MKIKIGKKKYRVRKFSIAWWTIYAGGTLFTLFGYYLMLCVALSM